MNEITRNITPEQAHMLEQRRKMRAAEERKLASSEADPTLLRVEAGSFIADTQRIGDKLIVVIANWATSHRYWDGPFTPQNPHPPVCHALGRAESDMVPDPSCESVQAPRCAGCPQRVFGTSTTGKGTACKQSRVLAVLPAGEFRTNGETVRTLDDPLQVEGTAMFRLNVPPGSLRSFQGYVHTLADKGLSTDSVYTMISLGEVSGNVYTLQFADIAPMDGAMQLAVMHRESHAARFLGLAA